MSDHAPPGSAGVAAVAADLTSDWLSAAIGRRVEDLQVSPVGTGQTGVTYRLTYRCDGEPATLIAKMAAEDPAARQRVGEGYRREVGFYRLIEPTVSVSTASCRYIAADDEAHTFTLLLDDLAPRVPGVQANGCSIAEAGLAVDNLVGLHAPRWNDASLFDLPFVDAVTVGAAEFIGAITVSATDEFIARYRSDLADDDVDTLRAAAASMAPWMTTRMQPFAAIHGDYRLDNLLFAPDGSDVVVVDWQTVSVGPPMRDVAYFLGTSLDVDDRRRAEQELVARYHSALSATGISGYDAHECWTDYRLGQLQAPMITTLGCIYATGVRSAASDAMFLAMASRACAAIRDHHTLGLIE